MTTHALLLDEHCLWRATRRGDILGRMLDSARKDPTYLSWDVMVSHAPFASIVTGPWCRGVILFLALWLVVAGSVNMSHCLSDYGVVEASFFKLVSEPDSAGSSSQHVRAPPSFQLLRQGCPHTQGAIRTTGTANEYILSFPRPQAMDGFEVANRTRRFRVLASQDGRLWGVAGSSDYRRRLHGVRFLSGEGDTSRTRFGHRVYWPLIL